jgi:predicted neutral ceramidase superfamily lipid hydrolase
MPELEFISPYQLSLPILIASFLQFEFKVVLEAFRNDGESTILPVIPLKVIRIEGVNLMEFALLQLLAFDGRVEPDIITSGSLKHDGAAFVLG